VKRDIRDYINGDLLLGDDLVIDDDENLLVTGILDSLALMRLVAHLEDTYDIEIPPSDITLENFASLGTMAGYLGARLEIEAA
jgi:acyl carrier protein